MEVLKLFKQKKLHFLWKQLNEEITEKELDVKD